MQSTYEVKTQQFEANATGVAFVARTIEHGIDVSFSGYDNAEGHTHADLTVRHIDGIEARFFQSDDTDAVCTTIQVRGAVNTAIHLWGVTPDMLAAVAAALDAEVAGVTEYTGDANARRTAAVSPPLSTSIPSTGISQLPHPGVTA